MVFSDRNDDGVVGVTDIEQINNYYPFGMNMDGPWNGAKGAFKYQYNGKEWNGADFSDGITGLNWNDYGARFYDPAIARWWSVDPLSEKFHNWSAFNYVKDNPIKFIDPDGADVDSVKPYTQTLEGNASLPLVGKLIRHSFLRVKTDKEDLVIELGGPDDNIGGAGTPVIKNWDDGQLNRTEVIEQVVIRPSNSPEGDYKFENQIIETAKKLSETKIDEKTGKKEYPNLPKYDPINGPNSNGYINFLISNAGGKLRNAPMAIANDNIAPYSSTLKRIEILNSLRNGSKILEEARKVEKKSQELLKNH